MLCAELSLAYRTELTGPDGAPAAPEAVFLGGQGRGRRWARRA